MPMTQALRRGGWLALLPACATAQYAPTPNDSLQFYGRLDLSINVQKVEDAPSRKSLSSDTSWFGVRGTERLGGPLSAYFKMEHGFDASTGQQTSAAAFWNRETFVGIRHDDLGSIELGSQWVPAIYMTGKVDPFARSQIGAHLTLFQGVAARGNAVQFSNAIEYTTPTLGGFSARVMLQAPEGTLNKNRALGIDYAGDRLYVGLAYDDVQVAGSTLGVPAVANTRSRNLGIGATYRLDGVKLAAFAQQNRVHGLPSVNGYLLGATVPVGTGEIRASAAHTDRAGKQASLFAIGYAHHLSKRTMAYVDAGLLKNGGTARYAMWPASQEFGAPPPGSDIRGVQIGVRHVF